MKITLNAKTKSHSIPYTTLNTLQNPMVFHHFSTFSPVTSTFLCWARPGAASSDLDRADALGDAASATSATAPLRKALRQAQRGGDGAEKKRCAKMLEVDKVAEFYGLWMFYGCFMDGLWMFMVDITIEYRGND